MGWPHRVSPGRPRLYLRAPPREVLPPHCSKDQCRILPMAIPALRNRTRGLLTRNSCLDRAVADHPGRTKRVPCLKGECQRHPGTVCRTISDGRLRCLLCFPVCPLRVRLTGGILGRERHRMLRRAGRTWQRGKLQRHRGLSGERGQAPRPARSGRRPRAHPLPIGRAYLQASRWRSGPRHFRSPRCSRCRRTGMDLLGVYPRVPSCLVFRQCR